MKCGMVCRSGQYQEAEGWQYVLTAFKLSRKRPAACHTSYTYGGSSA